MSKKRGKTEKPTQEDSGRGTKRTKGEASAIEPQNATVARRVTRSRNATASQSHRETNKRQKDTAASPFQAEPSTGHPGEPYLLSPRSEEDDGKAFATLAAESLKHNHAATHDKFLTQIQLDDELAEHAYRRGLLANFKISLPLTSLGPLPPIEVEAPEYANVAYLKRRITKARLLVEEGAEYCPPERFNLKRKTGNKELLPDNFARGQASLLLNLGFVAGKTYDLSLISRAASNDEDQQQKMLNATARGTVPYKMLDNPQVRAYQEALRGGPIIGGQASADEAGPSNAAAGKAIKSSPAAARAAAQGPPPAPLGSPQVVIAIEDGQGGGGGGGKGLRKRWTTEEEQALIQGCQQYQPGQWAKIRKAFPILESRKPVHLKDKWRNLVEAAKRGAEGLSPDEISLILYLEDTRDQPKVAADGSVAAPPPLVPAAEITLAPLPPGIAINPIQPMAAAAAAGVPGSDIISSAAVVSPMQQYYPPTQVQVHQQPSPQQFAVNNVKDLANEIL